MLTIKQGIKLSAIIDKMGLEVKATKVAPDGTTKRLTQEEVGADLIMQGIKNLHKAENELYAFVASAKKCTVQEAEEVDVVAFIKDMFSDAATLDFLKSAANTVGQE
jgi:hypothetical protein